MLTAPRYHKGTKAVLMNLTASANDYHRVEKAILALEKNLPQHPALKEVAQSVNLSQYHFQRLFRRWAGISPKRFLQLLTFEHAKQMMNGSASLLNAAYEAGLSGTGRLHDLFVSIEAVTPGEFRQRGRNLRILYGFVPSPFGDCFIALTSRGICHLAFAGSADRKKIMGDFKKQWRFADIQEDSAAVKPYIERIFGPAPGQSRLTLHIRGTNFQIKVWQALLKIPRGRIVSYEDIATEINRPKAARAVASAVAHNPVAFLIPCHRVLRKTGAMGGYRWGVPRKKAMLAWEAEKIGTPGHQDRG
jgi:AraC family transcriptional regulator, regulatory protein of adaptative response / methylated-DNA-[protein]-cysteine methyltransferase